MSDRDIGENRLRIILVISSMQVGGAQRVACILANAWAARGDKVTILTFEPEGDTTTFQLSEDVRIKRLGLDASVSNRLQVLKRIFRSVCGLRKAIRNSNPDVVVSFMGQVNLLTILSCTKTGIPVIVTEHCCPEFDPIGRGWEALRKLIYRRAAMVLVLTSDMRRKFEEILRATIRVLPNPVIRPEAAGRTGGGGRRKIVAAGRFVYQKHFDALIRAFGPLADKHPKWDLVIHGDGDEREGLERLVDELGLSGRVLLPGWTTTLDRDLAEGDIFAMPSRFEGFPMVLCEAMSVGLPAVAFDCLSGPADIIRHGQDGFLVPLEELNEFSSALDGLMRDDDLRRETGLRAREVAQRFSLERVLGMWDDCFSEVMTGQGGSLA